MTTPLVRTAGTTAIHVDLTCECPFSIAEEYAVAYLERAQAGGPEATVGISLPLPLPRFGRRVAISFGLATDVTERGRRHDEVRIVWASGSPLFPNFRGTIRFRIHRGSTLMTVDGSYDPPFGVAGAVFDRAIGRWIALASLRNLAGRLRNELERRQREWSATFAALEA
jgi:hypothetical protein